MALIGAPEKMRLLPIGVRPRVLVLAKSAEDASAVIREQFGPEDCPEVVTAATPEALVPALESGEWDVLLAVHPRSGSSVAAARELLRQRGLNIPLIAVPAATPTGAAHPNEGGTSDYRSAPDYRAIFQTARLPMWVSDLETLRFLEVNEAAVRQYGYSREEFLSMTLADIRLPEHSARLLPAREPGCLAPYSAGIWRHLRKDGTSIDVEAVAQPVVFMGRPAEAVFAIDVTARLEAQAEMAERDRLSALSIEVSSILSRAGSMREALEQCAESLNRHIEAAFVRIWTASETGDVLELQASAGMYTKIDGVHARVRVGDFKIGRIALEGKPHLTNHVLSDSWVGDPDWARREGMVSFAGYPLMVGDRVVGVLAGFARHALSRVTLEAFASVAGNIAQFVDRKRAELAVLQSDERIRLLLDSTSEAVLGMDVDGRFTFANRACLELIGYGGFEVLSGRNVHEIIHHSRADGSPFPIGECRVHQTLIDGEGAHIDGEVLWRADGTSFPAECWCHPVSKDGQIVGGVFTFRDISKRRQAEDEQRKLVALIDNTDDLVALSTPEGKITYLNQGGARLAGLEDPHQACGLDISEFHSDTDWARIRAEAMPALAASGRWKGESRIRNLRTGELMDVSMTAFAIRRAEGGEVLCLGSIMRDIRPAKRAEGSLRQAKEAAEAANRAKSQFLANMSHEIRTPMNAIIGMTELALATALNEEQNECLITVRDSANALLGIINGILDLSKIEAGKFVFEAVRFDPREVVAGAARTLEVEARRKGLELTAGVDSAVPHELVGDPMRLRQVLINLLGNAVKFTECGRVSVETMLEEGGQNPRLHFVVTDTGIGIPAEKHGFIFEPFAQADGSLTRRRGGTGLGLAISARYAEIMGGPHMAGKHAGRRQPVPFHGKLPKRPRGGRGEHGCPCPSGRSGPRRAADHSPGGRQLREPETGYSSARKTRAQGGAGRHGSRGHRRPLPAALRRCVDGRADAGDGRLGGDRRDS